VGSASDFLGLSQAEEALAVIRLALGDEVRAARTTMIQKRLQIRPKRISDGPSTTD
jgi:hypothetical protein